MELNDTRVLIPRVRRAVEGPDAPGGSAATGLEDEQINNIIADAIADVIFYTGGLFGHTLQVSERDEDYSAPIAWTIDPVLEESEATVIVAQAALNHFFHVATTLKTSEEISNEGQSWSYSYSAQTISEKLKALRALRDEALEVIKRNSEERVLDSWISTINARDSQTSVMIEPWVHGMDWGGGQRLGGV